MTLPDAFLGRLRAGIAAARQSTLTRGFAGVGGLTVAELTLSLLTAILLARALGVEGFGTYSLAFAAVVLAGVPVEFGLPSLVLREVAHHDIDPESGLVKGVLIFAVTVIVIMSAVIVPLALVFGNDLVSGIEETERAILPVAVGLIPLSAFGKTAGAALSGKQRVVIGLLPQRLVRPAVFAIALVAVSLLAPGWLTPVRAMALQLAAAAIALVVGGVQFALYFGSVFRQTRTSILWQAWSASMIRLGISNGIHVAQGQILLLMTGALSSVENVGLLRVAQRGAGLVALGNAIAVAATLPKIARLNAEGRHELLQRLLTLIARASATFALVTSIGFLLGGDWLMKTLFGAEFVAALGALFILAAAETTCALFGPGAVLLNMLRREGVTAQGFLISLVIGALTGAALIPSLGEVGAAIGGAAGLISMSVFLWRQSRRCVELDPSVLDLAIRRNDAASV